MQAHTLEEKEKLLANAQEQDYIDIDEHLSDVFNIYRSENKILNKFKQCLNLYEKEGKMIIKVELVLNELLANVIRGYTANKDDFRIYTHLLTNIEHYEIVPFDDNQLLQNMEKSWTSSWKKPRRAETLNTYLSFTTNLITLITNSQIQNN